MSTNLRFRGDLRPMKNVGINANLPNFAGVEVELVQVNQNKDYANVLYKAGTPCSKWSAATDLMARGMETEKDANGELIPRSDMVLATCKGGEVTFIRKPEGEAKPEAKKGKGK